MHEEIKQNIVLIAQEMENMEHCLEEIRRYVRRILRIVEHDLNTMDDLK